MTRSAEEWQWSSTRARIMGETDESVSLFPWLDGSKKRAYCGSVMEQRDDGRESKSDFYPVDRSRTRASYRYWKGDLEDAYRRIREENVEK